MPPRIQWFKLGDAHRYRKSDTDGRIYIHKLEEPRPFLRIYPTETHAEIELLSGKGGFDTTLSHGVLQLIIHMLGSRSVRYLIFNDYYGEKTETHKWVCLSDVYFLTTGKTWYSSVFPIESEDTRLFAHKYKKMVTATWDTVIERMNESNGSPIALLVDISDIDTSIPGSAMEVFRRIKDEDIEFFASYNHCVMPSLGFNSFFGSTWRYYFHTTPGTVAVPGHSQSATS